MPSHIARLALAGAVVMLLAPSADAQSSRLQKLQQACAKTKDPVKCTCLFSSGARLYHRPGGTRGVGIEGMANVDRYIACMRRSGRPNG
jgi:hypothetical protein